jgi:hypothetical protein
MKRISPSENIPIVILLCIFLVGYLTAIWQQTRIVEPATVPYCTKYDRLGSGASCLETTTLLVDQKYFHVRAPRQNLSDISNPIEISYPSMRPWSELAWFDRWNSHKISIRLFGASNRTPNDHIDVYFLGTPKPVLQFESLYGLEVLLYKSWGELPPKFSLPQVM